MAENQSERTIDEQAAGPRRVVIDSQDVQTHSLPDLIAFEKWKADRDAAQRPTQPQNIFGGIRVGKVCHPPTY